MVHCGSMDGMIASTHALMQLHTPPPEEGGPLSLHSQEPPVLAKTDPGTRAGETPSHGAAMAFAVPGAPLSREVAGNSPDARPPDDREMFNRSWNSFMLSRDLDPMPAIFNRNPMDLYRLFKYVALSGGHEKVTGHKLWAKIGRAFNPPTSMTDLSYQVKKIYMAKLAAYEEAYHQNAVGYAIDAQESFVDSLESGARLPPTLKKRKLTPGTNIRAAKDSGWTVGSSQSPQAAALRRVVPLASGSKIDSPDESLATATQVFTTTGGCAGFEIFTFFPGVTLDEIKVRCWPSGHVVLRVQPQQADRSGLEETLILPLGSGQCLDTSNAQALFTSEGRLYVRVNIA